jgi:hypothetical protein
MGKIMKRHVIMALAALLAASSVPLIPQTAQARASAEAARVRAGTIEGVGRGRYRVNLNEGDVDTAYRSAVGAARASGRRAPSRSAFRATVNREIREAVSRRYPRGVPSGTSATIIIIVAGDNIIIIIV